MPRQRTLKSSLHTSAKPFSEPPAKPKADDVHVDTPHIPSRYPRTKAVIAAIEEAKGKIGRHPIGFDNDVELALHLFDMDQAYGPSEGMSRRARWDRAQRLGLRPPPGISELLM